jgi:biotin operon repressor
MPEQGRDGNTRARRHARYSDALKQRTMRYLQLRYDRFKDQEKIRPVSAIVLARALKHWPGMKRETQRRRVRELVDEMRREGAPIASGAGGYSIAREVDDFERTEAFLRRHGLATLATNARLKQTAARARAGGQLRFAPYHAAMTGGLAAYLNQNPATARGAAGHQAAAPPTAERSGPTWPDSLFAA